MARQTKVGMLVAFGVILLMGIIVSDHLSAVRRQEPADLGGLAPITAAGLTNQEVAPENNSPLPLPGDFNQVNQPGEPLAPASPAIPAPGSTIVKSPLIATGPAPDTFVITKVNAPVSDNNVIGSPSINLGSDGQIPGVPANTEKIHTVVKGDSLFSIAKQYYHDGNQWKKIADANKLTKNSQLKLGMKLSIPIQAGKPAVEKTPSTQPTPPATKSNSTLAGNNSPDTDTTAYMTYTVKSGDTLGGIAGKTLGSKNKWQIILDANKENLKKPEALKPGMTLKIPRGSAV